MGLSGVFWPTPPILDFAPDWVMSEWRVIHPELLIPAGCEILLPRVLMIGCRDISGQNARLGPEQVIVLKGHVIQ